MPRPRPQPLDGPPMGQWYCHLCRRAGTGGESGWVHHYDTVHYEEQR